MLFQIVQLQDSSSGLLDTIQNDRGDTVHIDVSNIITAVVSLILGYFAFNQNSKKNDLDKTQESHDYIKEQNKRLNAENKNLLKENNELKEELKKYE